MAFYRYNGYLENTSTGKPLDRVLLRIYSSPGNVLQTVYADSAGTPKPVVETDENGAYFFYAAIGDYDIEPVYGGQAQPRLVAEPVVSGAVLAALQLKSERGVPVTPYDFGAVGWDNPTYQPGDSAAAAPDDAIPLQAFYDFVFAGDCKLADDTGLWATTVGIIYGPVVATAQRAVHVQGNCTIVAKAPIVSLFTLRNTKEHQYHGHRRLIGVGSYAYNTRTCRDAIAFSGNNVSSGVTGSISCYFFQNWGLDISAESLGSTFAEWFTCPHVYALACGSGDTFNPTYSVTSTYNTRVDSGGANSDGQRTTITVGTLPPSFIDANLALYPHDVIMNGKVYQIMSVDRALSKITVFPWMLSGDPASGNLTYVFGGGVVEHGVDANLVNIGSLSAIFCGFGRLASSAYPGMFNNVTAQNTPIASAAGIAPVSTCIGGGIVDLYCEQNVLFQFVGHTSGRKENNNARFRILSNHEESVGKFYALAPNSGTVDRFMYGLERYKFPDEIGQWVKGTQDVAQGFADQLLSEGPDVVSWHDWDNPLVRLYPFDVPKFNVSGRSGKLFIFSGTGANKQPTGTVTINANAIAAKTINGANTVTYTGLKGPLAVFVSGDPATGNFIASRISIPMDTGWTTGTGTANKGAFAAYAGQTVTATYVQAEAQAVANAARDASQRVLALEASVRALGGIN